MNDIELQQRRSELCNELKIALEYWNAMNDSLAAGATHITKAQHDMQRMKVDSLVRELENLDQRKAS